ncbi:NADPH oxidase 3 [Bulinus truncatus]|nr:NADPH oxidase 3 [Bulinus truncatus]
MVDWMINEAPRWIVIGIWLILNGIIFGVTFVSYRDGEEYYYLRALLGDSLCWARGSAACLNFNMMLILLPVCRKLISLIRGSVRDWSDAQTSKKDDIRNFLSRLPYTQNGSWINPIRTSNPDLTKELMKTVAGVTGVVITLCLIIMVSSSTEIVRRSYFELFWFTHHVYIIFCIGFVIHGAERLIHHQTNLDTHPIADCSSKYRRGVAVVTHQSRVFEIQTAGFKAAPGQYILIQCPSISRLEWHPFTLTSAPMMITSQSTYAVGDWTNALADLCHVDKEEFRDASKCPGQEYYLHDDVTVYDAVTGLHHKTHFGRPQWENVFRELSQLHRGMSTEFSSVDRIHCRLLYINCATDFQTHRRRQNFIITRKTSKDELFVPL